MKSLPIYTNPLVLTSCVEAFRQSILMTDDKYLIWIYENYINVVLTRQNKVDFSFRYYEHDEELFLTTYDEVFTFTPFYDYMSISKKITDSLDEDKYIFIYVDMTYLKESNVYKKKKEEKVNEDYHEILIYGYDKTSKEFQYLSYNVNGQTYGTAKCSYASLKRAFDSALKQITANKDIYRYLLRFYLPFCKAALNENFQRELNIYKIYTAILSMNNHPLTENKKELHFLNTKKTWYTFFENIYCENIEITNKIIHQIKLVIESKKIFVDLLDYIREKHLFMFSDCLYNNSVELLKMLKIYMGLLVKIKAGKSGSKIKKSHEYLNSIIAIESKILNEIEDTLRNYINNPVFIT